MKAIRLRHERFPEDGDPLKLPDIDPTQARFVQLTWRSRKM